MSDNNVEIARRAVEAFNEGGLEATQEFWADEMEFHEPPEQPAPRVARGREETAKMFGEFEEAWAEHRSEPEEIRAIDSDRVLVLSIEHFRGRDGMEVSAPCAQVFTISGDKIVRYQAFWKRETALAATEVSE